MSFRRIVFGFVGAWLAAGHAAGAPVITDFSPTAGTAGDTIQLIGSGFSAGGFTVLFWNGRPGVPAAGLSVTSDTTMTAIVPSGITTGPISIQQGASQPSSTPNDFVAIGSGPYITGITPAYGSVGDTVEITGVHFANTIGVFFNGTNAPEFTANAAGTQISTRVPPGATSGLITVSTINGSSDSPVAFTVVGVGPYITDFTPTSGVEGTKVQVDGLHFTGVTNVTFNGQPGTIVSATSDTLLQVLAPTGLVTGPITVSTMLGSFTTSSNFFGNPVITGASPLFGRAGTNVSITGKNFLGATAVSFGGVTTANFNVVNNTNISAAVPVGAPTGLIRVVVPGASAFSATNFIVRPTIAGFSPTFGPVGTSVTITGANLNAGTPKVSFNGVQAATPTGITFGQLTVKVPTGATTGLISLITADGGDTNANLFYLPATITSISSTNSPTGSRVTISGQNFTGTEGVSFGGVAAAEFTVSNNTTIGAIVPSGAVSGPITVTTPAGVASSSQIFYGIPLITGFTPTHGLPGTNVTIRGESFLGGHVLVGPLAATVVSLNNTQIVATVPSGAKTGPITVYGPGGTNTSSANFILDYPSDLQIGITSSSGTVTVGSNLVYTISGLNVSPNPAANPIITNLLPANVLLSAASVSSGWTLATNGNTLTASSTNFGSSNSVSLVISVIPQVAGSITDTVSIGSDTPDPVSNNNKASITTLVAPPALLSIGHTNGQVTVSWPVALTNYVLQFQDAIAPGAQWSAFTNPPVINGSMETVADPVTGSSRFYRLKR